MEQSLQKIKQGYSRFREKYASGDHSIMARLAYEGQKPEVMILSCSDSRVDPALLFQSKPGELFVARNVANIVPPYELDESHHGTSAALEYGICHLNVKHLIILGHSQCGGVCAFTGAADLTGKQDDFISSWVNLLDGVSREGSPNDVAKRAMVQSRKNCLEFPWIKERLESNALKIHLWFFDIESATISAYSDETADYHPLS